MKAQQLSLARLINPTDRQQEFFRAVAEHDFTFYGGAAGGGKSYILRWALVWLLVGLYQMLGIKNAVVALFCEDYPSLYDRQIIKMQSEFPPWLGRLRLGETKDFQLHEQFGGGTIALRNLDKPEKYLSAEFAGIAVDELTKNTKGVFDFLRLRLRWPGVEHPKFIAGSNPGGVGHGWVKSLWIDREFPLELTSPIDFRPQFAFVPAKSTDNPHLSQTYWNQLGTLPPEMQQIYVDGRWDVFAGQYFDVFDPIISGKHVKPPQEFNLQPWTTRWIGVDYGFGHPCAMHWFAQPQTDLTVTYREYLSPGRTPVQIGEKIKELSEGEDISAIYLSPDARQNRTGADTIEDQINKVLKNSGLPFTTPAEDDRKSGWAMMYDYFRRGMWQVGSNCPHLIKTLPILTRDPKKYEDCIKFDATPGKMDGDDAADSARYGLRSHFKEAPKPYELRVQERLEVIPDMTQRMLYAHKVLKEEKKVIPAPFKLRRGMRR